MIVDARISGLSFCELSEADQSIIATDIVATASAITGCNTPGTEFFFDRLRREIITFVLNFGFRELTEDEIYLALRLNARGGLRMPSGVEIETIPFFGNTFNIDYFSKVLSNYLSLRNLLDRKLQNEIDGY